MQDKEITKEPDKKATDIGMLIDQWFVDCINNSPASRDTEVYNQLRKATEELKTRLKGKGYGTV